MIYDVAKAAGVTAAIIAYVFSGKSSVSDVTRERVLKRAQELDYRQNQIAHSLIKRRTKQKCLDDLLSRRVDSVIIVSEILSLVKAPQALCAPLTLHFLQYVDRLLLFYHVRIMLSTFEEVMFIFIWSILHLLQNCF